jgi:hypothetical protein
MTFLHFQMQGSKGSFFSNPPWEIESLINRRCQLTWFPNQDIHPVWNFELVLAIRADPIFSEVWLEFSFKWALPLLKVGLARPCAYHSVISRGWFLYPLTVIGWVVSCTFYVWEVAAFCLWFLLIFEANSSVCIVSGTLGLLNIKSSPIWLDPKNYISSIMN